MRGNVNVMVYVLCNNGNGAGLYIYIFFLWGGMEGVYDRIKHLLGPVTFVGDVAHITSRYMYNKCNFTDYTFLQSQLFHPSHPLVETTCHKRRIDGWLAKTLLLDTFTDNRFLLLFGIH